MICPERGTCLDPEWCTQGGPCDQATDQPLEKDPPMVRHPNLTRPSLNTKGVGIIYAEMSRDEAPAPAPTYVSSQLHEVQAERDSQDRIHPEQLLPYGTDAALKVEADVARKECDDATSEGSLTWMHVLTEEYFEVISETDEDKLRAELLQLAAVCVRIVEQIDSGDTPTNDCG